MISAQLLATRSWSCAKNAQVLALPNFNVQYNESPVWQDRYTYSKYVATASQLPPNLLRDAEANRALVMLHEMFDNEP